MKDFRDKVVVITGAGSGIGRATALAFAREGARLHLADIVRERVEKVAREACDLGASATAHVVDCTRPEEMQALADAVIRAGGRVDILHNNAGVCVGGPIEEITIEDWRWTLDVNLWGVVHGIRAFLPCMIRAGGGHIVNTASMAGLLPFPFVAPYVASKFAVVGLSEALSAELSRHNIQVTAVCPGSVRTNVMRDGRLHLPGDWPARIASLVDRYGADPERVARDVLDAIRKERGLQISGAAFMLPLWLLKRISEPLFRGMSALLTTRAAGK